MDHVWSEEITRELAGIEVMLHNCIRKVLGSNLDRITSYPVGSYWFPVFFSPHRNISG
jgi:hypothetical protein